MDLAAWSFEDVEQLRFPGLFLNLAKAPEGVIRVLGVHLVPYHVADELLCLFAGLRRLVGCLRRCHHGGHAEKTKGNRDRRQVSKTGQRQIGCGARAPVFHSRRFTAKREQQVYSTVTANRPVIQYIHHCMWGGRRHSKKMLHTLERLRVSAPLCKPISSTHQE